MTKPIFLDTNLWVYLYDKRNSDKSQIVSSLVECEFKRIIVTTQVIGELFNVFIRKKIVEEETAQIIVKEIIETFPVVAIDTFHVLEALEVRKRYKYTYWDSLIIASAIAQGCEFLYSEDMQHDQLFGDNLTLINPFI